MKGPSTDQQQQMQYSGFHGYLPDQQLFQSQVAAPPHYQNGNFNDNNSGSRPYYNNHAPPSSNYSVPLAQEEQANTAADDSNPFAEYAWMADADEFDKQVMEQMEQEEFFEACVRQLCDDEADDWCPPSQDDAYYCQGDIEGMRRLTINETVVNSALNPNADEFVPRWVTTKQ